MQFWPDAAEWNAAGVYPTNISYLKITGRDTPWSVDFYCFHLVRRGPVNFYSKTGGTVEVGTGELFLIEAQVPFFYHSLTGEPIEIYALRLHGPLVREYVTQIGFHGGRVAFPARDPAEVEQQMVSLLKLGRRSTPESRFEVLSRLAALPLSCGYAPGGPQESLTLPERVLQHVEASMEEGENVEELSRRFGVSRYTLFQHFRKRFDESPVQVLLRMRIDRARELLRTTDLQVSEIARLCGYRHVEHFHRQFRDSCGMTPAAWRRLE